MQWAVGAVSPGVKWQEHEVNSYAGSGDVGNGGATSPHPRIHGMLNHQIPGM